LSFRLNWHRQIPTSHAFRAFDGLIQFLTNRPAILVLSSIALSFLGWEALHSQLAADAVLPDMVLGLKIGWKFGVCACWRSASSCWICSQRACAVSAFRWRGRSSVAVTQTGA
jgi:hypothetical protein